LVGFPTSLLANRGISVLRLESVLYTTQHVTRWIGRHATGHIWNVGLDPRGMSANPHLRTQPCRDLSSARRECSACCSVPCVFAPVVHLWSTSCVRRRFSTSAFLVRESPGGESLRESSAAFKEGEQMKSKCRCASRSDAEARTTAFDPCRLPANIQTGSSKIYTKNADSSCRKLPTK
jgi:hypothetical protein